MEKSISEQARAEFGDTGPCTVFRSCTSFSHGMSRPPLEGESSLFVCVCVQQSLQSRAIHQFAVVDEKKPEGEEEEEEDRAEKNVPIVKVPRG